MFSLALPRDLEKEKYALFLKFRWELLFSVMTRPGDFKATKHLALYCMRQADHFRKAVLDKKQTVEPDISKWSVSFNSYLNIVPHPKINITIGTTFNLIKDNQMATLMIKCPYFWHFVWSQSLRFWGRRWMRTSASCSLLQPATRVSVGMTSNLKMNNSKLLKLK